MKLAVSEKSLSSSEGSVAAKPRESETYNILSSSSPNRSVMGKLTSIVSVNNTQRAFYSENGAIEHEHEWKGEK